MARDHARIYLSIWESTDFTGLTISEQWTYFALISSPDLSWGRAPRPALRPAGGLYIEWNLQLACVSCNMRKGARRDA
jgi:hypothetical protein